MTTPPTPPSRQGEEEFDTIVRDYTSVAYPRSKGELRRRLRSLLLAHDQRLVEEILDDLWEQSQKDDRGFGKAYSYLVTKYKPAAVKALIEEGE